LVTATLSSADVTEGAGTLLGNYILPTTASGAIGAITPATLTFTANPIQRPAQAADPSFTGRVSGFAGTDTQLSATMGSLLFTTDAITASPSGLYAINGTGLSATNYVFQQASSNATALTISAALPNFVQIVAQNIVTTSTAIVASSVAASIPAPTVVSAPVARTAAPVSTPAPAPVTKTAAPARAPPPAAGPAAAAPASGRADSAPPPAPSPAVAVVSVAAPPVDALPPSPVPDTPPPTPADAADGGDPILQSVAEAPTEAPQTRWVGAIVSQLSPHVSVSVSLPVKPTGAPGIETRFSLAGNPAGF